MPGPTVLHVLRDDHGGHVGGDLVQLHAAVDGLRAEGVDAVAATVADGPARVDLVHLYNLQRPGALARDALAARRRWPGAPVVLSPIWWPARSWTLVRTGHPSLVRRGAKSAVKGALWWPAARTVLGRVDLLLPNSRAEARAVARSFRVSVDGRCVVVPNGIDLERWPYRRVGGAERAATLGTLGLATTSGPIVACVARLEPSKNQLALLEAVATVDGAALVLVGPDGDVPYADEVRRAATRLPGRVALAGRRSPAEVADLLAAADVHVLASFRETLGLASLEAAAVGCAVVVTREGGALEYFGETVRAADPADPASLAAAIRAAHADPRQPAARRRVEGYDWSAAVPALMAAYGTVRGAG